LHKFYKALLKGERRREEGRYIGKGRQVDSALPNVKYVTIFMTSLVQMGDRNRDRNECGQP